MARFRGVRKYIAEYFQISLKNYRDRIGQISEQFGSVYAEVARYLSSGNFKKQIKVWVIRNLSRKTLQIPYNVTSFFLLTVSYHS